MKDSDSISLLYCEVAVHNVCMQQFDLFQTQTTAYIYLPTPPLGQDMTQGQFWNGV